jgi:hypothetical protein
MMDHDYGLSQLAITVLLFLPYEPTVGYYRYRYPPSIAETAWTLPYGYCRLLPIPLSPQHSRDCVDPTLRVLVHVLLATFAVGARVIILPLGMFY